MRDKSQIKVNENEVSIYTLRFRKLMQLIRLKRKLDKAKITHKPNQ
jgi:hypothetical protein